MQVAEAISALPQIPCSKPVSNVYASVPDNWVKIHLGDLDHISKKNGKKTME